MGKSEKQAGSRFEAWVRDKFKKEGWMSDRVRSVGITGEPDLYATKGGLILQIQTKETQRLNASKTLADLTDAIDLDVAPWSIPLLIWKRVERRGQTGKRMQVGPIMVAMPLEDFFELTRNHS